MEYTFVERTAKQQGHNWFGHQISVFVSSKMQPDLKAFLLESFGPKGKEWRFTSPRRFSIFERQNTLIRFAEKSHAMLFKLSWEEETYEDYWKNLSAKIALNSSFGAISSLPSYHTPAIYPTTPGIFPTSSGSYTRSVPMSQSLSRTNRHPLTPCTEIVMVDYESSADLSWFHKYVTGMECDSWSAYNRILDSTILDESMSRTCAVMNEVAKEFATSFDMSKIRS